MRVGKNPNKDKKVTTDVYKHQVVIPVYISNSEAYFKDSFEIFQYCIQSLLRTKTINTYITIVNNGSSPEVVDYINALQKDNAINEVINTSNIGKINAILKGVSGHDFELVTIADADVMFLDNWLEESIKVFNAFPKAGVVGVVPQFKLYADLSFNVLFDFLFSKKMRFRDVINPEAIKQFYKSIGWDDNYNKDYLKTHLTVLSQDHCEAVVGSGHFMATYKREVINHMPNATSDMKMGGDLRSYFDYPVLKLGGWRLTTADNFAYHMGNVKEDWMKDTLEQLENNSLKNFPNLKPSNLKSSNLSYVLKNHVFRKLLEQKAIMKYFLKSKGLPTTMLKNY